MLDGDPENFDIDQLSAEQPNYDYCGESINFQDDYMLRKFDNESISWNAFFEQYRNIDKWYASFDKG